MNEGPQQGRGLVVIGVDPGLAAVGYSVVRFPERVSLRAATIRTSTSSSDRERVLEVARVLADAVRGLQRPAVLAIEEQERAWVGNLKRGNSNAKAVWPREVAGAVCGISVCWGVQLVEVTTEQVKAAALCTRTSPKAQVQRAVRAIVADLPTRLSQHAADATAVALAGERVVRTTRTAANG